MVKKHIIDVKQEVWKNVLRYKIDHDMRNNNEAVVDLIKKGLRVRKK